MKFKSLLIIILIIISLIGIKVIFLKPSGQKNAPAGGGMGKGAPIRVTAFVTSALPLENNIFSSGTVKAFDEVMLIPETAGKLMQLNFNEGSYVSKGTLLVKINDNDLKAQKNKLDLQLKLANEKVARLKSLLEIKGVSQEEFDAANNYLQTLESDIDFVKAQIAKTEIRAPFDGKIGLRNVSEGSFVNNSTIIASMQQTKQLKIDFTVPEKYASVVAIGNFVRFKVEYADENFQAKVIAIEPKIDEQTRNITIRAIYNNDKNLIFPGAFARVELVANKKQNAILIPTEAIIPELKGKKVFVSKSGKAIPIKVKTGVRNDAMIEIVDGLNVGDTVITTGMMAIKPESEVIITKIKQ